MKLNHEAVEQLIRVAEQAPAELIDMGIIDCGSSHCLMGWAMIDPWFKSQIDTEDENDMVDRWLATVDLIGLDEEQEDLLFANSCHIDGYRTHESGLLIKNEVLENLRRLKAGEPMIPYTGSLRRDALEGAAAP